MLLNAIWLTCLAVASSREIIRPIPTITNSLVNLGKMEISFYINGSNPNPQNDKIARSKGHLVRPEPIQEESCPCSALRNVKDNILSNPASILEKLLQNNNLFSSHNELISSAQCCESHENVQESTFVFEFPTNPKNNKPLSRSKVIQPNNIPLSNNAMPMLPFLFDTIIPNKSMLPPMKTKSIEIFLFPKKKGTFKEGEKLVTKKKDLVSSDDIQVVGDKEIKENVSYFKPVYPVVKKDLTFQEKNDKQQTKDALQATVKPKEKEQFAKEEETEMIVEPAGKPNAV